MHYEKEIKNVSEKCSFLEEKFYGTIEKMEQNIEELTQKNIIMNTINDNFTETISEISKNLWVIFIKIFFEIFL